MGKALSRRERKKQALTDNIFKTAIYLFRTKGFDETTIEEITNTLDISRATFFNYYASKNQILYELAERLVNNYKTILEDKLTSNPHTRETLCAIMDEIEDSMKGYKNLFRSVFLEIMRGQVGFIKGHNDNNQPTVNDLMAKIITRGQENGEIINKDPYLLAEMLTGSIFNIILNWLHEKDTYSLRERLKTSIHIFMESFATYGQTEKTVDNKNYHIENFVDAFERLKKELYS
jgi:AcrR family transcriptional regulator